MVLYSIKNEGKSMNVLGWIVLGLVAGSFAQTATGFEKRGCLFTMIVGIVGAFIGGALFSFVGSKPLLKFNVGSAFVAFIGGAVLCLILKVLERKR
jgi:uncharacterized membrane protein YeaQ/YmgE (transglycosylase-associated protein family)